MTYRGHVDGGVIVLDVPAKLPDGALVLVMPEKETKTKDPSGVAGSWVDDRTADEIIKDIRQSRRSRK
jgi:hypothetical protein